jgi:DNA polymerase I-like protein with 3'-5' exonuclease and polymerase domains
MAHMGQSMTADEMNNAMLQLWRINVCQILLQGHDSLLIQYPEEIENEVIPKVTAAMRVPLELEGGREFVVPTDVQVGWNWAKAHSDNPLGLAMWPDERARGEAKTQ